VSRVFLLEVFSTFSATWLCLGFFLVSRCRRRRLLGIRVSPQPKYHPFRSPVSWTFLFPLDFRSPFFFFPPERHVALEITLCVRELFSHTFARLPSRVRIASDFTSFRFSVFLNSPTFPFLFSPPPTSWLLSPLRTAASELTDYLFHLFPPRVRFFCFFFVSLPPPLPLRPCLPRGHAVKCFHHVILYIVRGTFSDHCACLSTPVVEFSV